MKKILLSMGLILPIVTIPKVSAGSFGAEIFCTMREGGNDHESSWEAAYSYIKKQKQEEQKRKKDEIEKNKRRKKIENMIEDNSDDYSNGSFDRYSY